MTALLSILICIQWACPYFERILFFYGALIKAQSVQNKWARKGETQHECKCLSTVVVFCTTYNSLVILVVIVRRKWRRHRFPFLCLQGSHQLGIQSTIWGWFPRLLLAWTMKVPLVPSIPLVSSMREETRFAGLFFPPLLSPASGFWQRRRNVNVLTFL